VIRGPGILLTVAIAAVGAAVVAGVSMLGSPATQRRQRLDSVRVEDLQPLSTTWSHEIGRQCFNRHVERRISSDAQLNQKGPFAPVARSE
jgi:hypothetical protein